MSAIVAEPNPVYVDNTANPAIGMTKISYKIDAGDEVWETFDGAAPTQKMGLPEKGSYPIYLAPGKTYRAGVYVRGHGPNSTDPVGVDVHAVAVLKDPTTTALVTDHSGANGGTWVNHGLKTSVPTTLVLAGVSRSAPTFDAHGWPVLVDPDVRLAKALGPSQSHMFELTPLAPGHHYFLTMVIVDPVGNWQVITVEFDSLRRKIAVQFSELKVYNDGDLNSTGEGSFTFVVFAPEHNAAGETVLGSYATYLDSIDGGHSYPLGFTYLEFEPMTISPTRVEVWVRSDGQEHDPWPEADDYAKSTLGAGRLNLPIGQQETVTHDSLLLTCPGEGSSDFRYGVVVDYSVAYIS